MGLILPILQQPNIQYDLLVLIKFRACHLNLSGFFLYVLVPRYRLKLYLSFYCNFKFASFEAIKHVDMKFEGYQTD